MKIIEAMKKVKENKEKIRDLQERIGRSCANLSTESPLYGDNTRGKIDEWLQTCSQLTQDNIKLLCAIQKTNLATSVTIEIGGNKITKPISEWVWRRREYAEIDFASWNGLSDRGLREGIVHNSTGQQVEVKIVRHFNPEQRDEYLFIYRSEPHRIDAALEVVNAVTDLVE